MGSSASDIRHDWRRDEILALLETPLLELVGRANEVHRRHHDPNDIQKASLLSIKTGGCPEDCGYCPQSAHHKDVDLAREALMDVGRVLERARAARDRGADRFCMGAAWREVRDGKDFDAVVEMVAGVRALGMEACVTLGMMKPHQAARLAAAGLTAYNHNIDTSPEFYGEIITTRRFDERIETLRTARAAGIGLCCGGIVGMGETPADRAAMLEVLAGFTPHPDSVPINGLVAIPGTPLADRPRVDPLDLVRTIAAARIAMPKARVRLSAGREALSREAQVLCFLAGANSLFLGDVLLTTRNVTGDRDAELFHALGIAAPKAIPAAAAE